MRTFPGNNLPAYTLLELLLVMALILLMAALTVPVMESMLSDSRITAAGDQIRGRMAEARAQAMDQGKPWKFAFLPNSSLYQLAPEDSVEWTGNNRDLVQKADVIRAELPKEIYFGVTQEDIQNGREPPTPGSAWTTAAVYLPDGSARDTVKDDGTVSLDTVTYFGKMGIVPQRIQLRGLTGVVTIEAVQPLRGMAP